MKHLHQPTRTSTWLLPTPREWHDLRQEVSSLYNLDLWRKNNLEGFCFLEVLDLVGILKSGICFAYLRNSPPKKILEQNSSNSQGAIFFPTVWITPIKVFRGNSKLKSIFQESSHIGRVMRTTPRFNGQWDFSWKRTFPSWKPSFSASSR